ncbi:MAG: tetratricopeptide repeat protein [Cyclobacteriaceae bacterium]
MINYALSILLFISVIPSGEVIEKRFNKHISKTSDHFLKGDLEAAKSSAIDAHQMATDHGYEWGETKSLFVLAFIHEKTREYENALPYYLESIGRYEQFGTTEAINDYAKVLFNIGNIMRVNDKHDLAIKYYNQGIEYALEHDLKGMLLDNLHNKIIVCNESGLYDLALETINYKNERISESDLPEKLKTINELGLLYENQTRFEEAIKTFYFIVEAEKNHPSSRFSGKAYNNIGNIFLKQGKTDKARKAFYEALLLAEKDDKTQDIYQIRQSLAITEKTDLNFEKALSHAKVGIELFDKVAKTRENIEFQSLISDLYLETGDILAGKKHGKRYFEEISNYFEVQEKLNSIGNQYKIDYITSSYFNKQEKQQTLYLFLIVIGAMIFSFLLYLLYQYYKKVQIAKLIREQMNSVSFDLDEL